MSVARVLPRIVPARLLLAAATALGLAAVRPGRSAGQEIAPRYSSVYSFAALGSPAGVPGSLGGLRLLAGDPNTLLIGGAANTNSGAIYSIGLARGAENRITGFAGTAAPFATAGGGGGGIDGGLEYGPNGVLFYTSYPDNRIGQIRPGSTAPDKLIAAGSLGIASSVGALAFVPAGAPGAGRLKILSYNANTFYDATVTPDGNGTFDITGVTQTATLSGGLEGAVYVPAGSPLFPDPAMLVSEYIAGRISAYDVDANGDPVASTRRDFLTGLTGAEGAFVDPLTGDFLFSTFGGGDRVISVRGFAPVPEPTGVTFGLAAAAAAVRVWRRPGRGGRRG